MDCFGTYFTHAQTCDNVRVQSATEWTASVQTLHMAQTCDDVRVQSATQSTASVHTLHMSKPVITLHTLLGYIPYLVKKRRFVKTVSGPAGCICMYVCMYM